jgi:hypothetical protein
VAWLKGDGDRLTGVGSVSSRKDSRGVYSGRSGARLNNVVGGQGFPHIIRDNSRRSIGIFDHIKNSVPAIRIRIRISSDNHGPGDGGGYAWGVLNIRVGQRRGTGHGIYRSSRTHAREIFDSPHRTRRTGV